mgnify:FL=1
MLFHFVFMDLCEQLQFFALFVSNIKIILYTKMSAEAKTQIFTKAEGEAIGAAYIASLKKGMQANDFTAQHDMMAEQLSWDWSGGVVGEGTKEDFYKVLAGSWQAVVSDFRPTNMYYVVDGVQGLIMITFDITLVMDGRGAVPITPTQVFTGTNMFELRLNADKKITHFRGVWDPVDPEMMAAMGNVMTAFGQKA